MSEHDDPLSGFTTEQRVEVWKSGIESINAYANDALRGLLILNGGAAIAILAFLGQVLSKGPEPPRFSVPSFVTPLMLFGRGVLCSAVASGLGFLSQLCFHDFHHRRSGNWFRFSAIAIVIVGWALFIIGLSKTGAAFIAAR